MTNRRRHFIINLLQMLPTHSGPIACLVNYVSQSITQVSRGVPNDWNELASASIEKVSEFAFFCRNKDPRTEKNKQCSVFIVETMNTYPWFLKVLVFASLLY